MPNKYSESHKPENLKGAGDARPTATEIIKDEGLLNKWVGKHVVITGVTGAIGKATAVAMLETGATLYLTARDVEKAKKVCLAIVERKNVHFVKLDNMDLSSVNEAAKEILSHTDKIHAVFNNAGIMACPFELSKDGHETQFQTNYLSHFLLFLLLRDALLKAAKDGQDARVINVSSSGHHASTVQFDNLTFEKKDSYQPFAGYGQSKTAMIWMSNEITRRYLSQGLTSYSLMPGGISSELQRFFPKDWYEARMAMPGTMAFMKSPEQGAATQVYAAVGKEWERRGGLYLEDCDVAEAVDADDDKYMGASHYKPWAFDQEGEKKLWRVASELVGHAEE